jgi:Ca2+-binding RTX toxin-like protein
MAGTMANNYSELATFMKGNKANPLSLAKVMTGWIWTSLLPSASGFEPTSAKSVPLVMHASCGWRDILMESLFEGIGIEHRRVNFYDVPFQANHTATELHINGKWMFFDSTFGIYFTRKGSSVPLSMEEARNSWPDVVIQQSTLKGWQGVFVDPDRINARTYSPTTDTFAYAPEDYYGVDSVVAGELYALYFVKKATYLDDNGEKSIGDVNRSWKLLPDTNGSKAWSKYTYFYDAKGRSDAQYILMDDKSHRFTHLDLDNRYDWLKKTTLVTAFSRLETSIVLYDDRSKESSYVDAHSKNNWYKINDHHDSQGRLDYETVEYDDGQTYSAEFDQSAMFMWSKYEDWADAAGNTTSTTITYDDGSALSYNWSVAGKIQGTSNSDSLAGTSGTDALFGMAGNDTLNGGAGVDRLEGGVGNDFYYADSVNAIVIERPNEGTDTVVASDSYVLPRNVEELALVGNAVYGTGQELDNFIAGNAVNNVISGLAGNDKLLGLDGDDLLTGAAGRDTIDGGLGTDLLYGGQGADTFLWRAVAEVGASLRSADRVGDFSAAQDDKLNFKLIDANEALAGNQAFAFIGNQGFSSPGQLRYVQGASETLIYLNTDQDASAEAVLRLSGKLIPDASWFVL